MWPGLVLQISQASEGDNAEKSLWIKVKDLLQWPQNVSAVIITEQPTWYQCYAPLSLASSFYDLS